MNGISEHLILRGLGLSLGGGVQIEEGTGTVSPYFHNQLEIIQVALHWQSFEILLGLNFHNIFSGQGALWWNAGVNITL